MSALPYIVDQPLPLSQDFRQLKEEGRAYLQEHMNYAWTNLNASDPGVTILDQVCYALTELGYCNDFPVQDILTRENGQLQIEDQFWLPEDILTTSPISKHDYRKFLIDGVSGVLNAVILRARNKNNTALPLTSQSWLMIDPTMVEKTVCRAAFAALNAARNAGELFVMPSALISKTIALNGRIDVNNKSEIQSILTQADQLIRDYIFPTVSPQGYSKLVDDGLETNGIFNGPRLQRGWIPDSSLGKKKNELGVLELVPLIQSVHGVNTVSGLIYVGQTSPTSVTCEDNELFSISTYTSFTSGQLQIWCQGEPVSPAEVISNNSSTEADYEDNILFGAKLDIQADLPEGKFRDINTYYSIQNTFPELYALGTDVVSSSASDFDVARSRQLKGYLTLFDQVLANQFSQLANIDRLFSFRNSMTGTPSDTYQYYAAQNRLGRKDDEYPVPYERFAPTCYYQSLYHIPYIRPLLKGNETFTFSLTAEPEQEMQKKSWEKYRLDPYNAYIHGLMQMMENETTSLQRRNQMLDHLLARHGESPEMINAYIDGSFYTHDKAKDKVIFKSLYLQNLQLLSYNRYKGYNYLIADKIVYSTDDKEYQLPEVTEETIDAIDKEHQLPEVTEEMIDAMLAGDTDDFIFDAARTDEREKLTGRDFVNFSGIELKMNLLFGFRTLYRNFMIHTAEKSQTGIPDGPNKPENQLALWFIEKRKGCIMVEMPLLLQGMQFTLVIAGSHQCWEISSATDNADTAAIIAGLSTMSQSEIETQLSATPPALKIGETTYALTAQSPVIVPSQNFHALKNSNYYYKVKVQHPGQGAAVDLPDFNCRMEFLFPGFIPAFNTTAFRDRVEYFLSNELPVHHPHHVQVMDRSKVNDVVTAFILWHESLRTNTLDDYPRPGTVFIAWNLLNKILNVYTYPTA